MKTIAIIDDDIHIGDMLREVLVQEGYSVLRAYSGTEALYLLSQNKPDLVLLDLMLPGLSGEEVLPHIENIPVIVLSAKVDVQDKVNLLLGGAADYMTKPFDTKELLARITVQLRKAEQHGETKSLSVGDLVLDMVSLSLTVQEQPVKLTRTEYAILKLLMENPKQVISKSVLLDRISLDTPDCTERSLKQHISNLRKKMQDVSKQGSSKMLFVLVLVFGNPHSLPLAWRYHTRLQLVCAINGDCTQNDIVLCLEHVHFLYAVHVHLVVLTAAKQVHLQVRLCLCHRIVFLCQFHSQTVHRVLRLFQCGEEAV